MQRISRYHISKCNVIVAKYIMFYARMSPLEYMKSLKEQCSELKLVMKQRNIRLLARRPHAQHFSSTESNFSPQRQPAY